MYLIKIKLSRSNAAIRAALLDGQKMHCLLTSLFASDRKGVNLLYRLNSSGKDYDAYLYADVPVIEENLIDGMELVGQREISDWLSSMQAGQMMHFDLLTMPYKKVRVEAAKNSKRQLLRTEQERLLWLSRKANGAGFSILSVQEQAQTQGVATHSQVRGGRFGWSAYCYQGLLQITDAELFQKTVGQGIGAGKAYGQGMLLLRR